MHGRKKLGARKEICPAFSDCARIVKKNLPEKLSKIVVDGGGGHISHKIDRISHKIGRICPIYFYNKPILPDCEANIARLALFAQQTRGAAPPPPGTPMVLGKSCVV